MVRLGADGIGNECANRKLAQTNGCLLRGIGNRCSGIIGTAKDGRNIVLRKSGIIFNNDCGVCGRE